MPVARRRTTTPPQPNRLNRPTRSHWPVNSLHSPGLEYETGQLAFLMDATVSASVMWHGHTTYPFTFSIHDYYIKVSDTTDYDRSLCNCTQMMQQGAALQPRREQEWGQGQGQGRAQAQEQGRRRRSEASKRLQAEGWGRGADLPLAADEVLLPPTMGENVKTE